MTTLSPAGATGSGATAGSPVVAPPGRRGEFVDVVRSEWTKFRSVRSTYWTLLATVVVTVGLAAAISAGFAHGASEEDKRTTDLVLLTLTGVFLSQLFVGVLGVLVITSEYGTGMIRTTLTAVPRRWPVLAAKAVVFAGTLVVGATATAFVAFLVGQAVLSPSLSVSLNDPGALRSVVGAGLYLTVVGLLGLGLGAIIRHTAGAISALVGLLLVLMIVVSTLPASLNDHLWKYLPSNAGSAIMQAQPTSDLLAPWTGFALFCGYTGVALAVGAVLLARRDA
jgi:ABC-type transport system involved in multi-copper enzyme maturation permease subunit